MNKHDSARSGVSAIPVVACLVFGPEGLLIARRPQGKHLAGYWEFPGGKIDDGEDLFAAAVREIREETGLVIMPEYEWMRVDHCYPDRRVILHFVVCAHVSGVAAPLDCDAVAWIRLNELSDYRFPPADRQVLDRLGELKEWNRLA
jgi:mutator protein MutT